jgi:hypothetical protein
MFYYRVILYIWHILGLGSLHATYIPVYVVLVVNGQL